MKKICLFLALVICLNVSAFSVESPKSDSYTPLDNRLGFSASMISGWGITYQKNFDPIALKFILFYYYSQNNDSYDYYSYSNSNSKYSNKSELGSLGLELKYYIFKSKYVNLYPMIGVSYWVNKNENIQTYYDYKTPPYKNYPIMYKDNSSTFNGGFGFGIELIAGRFVAFNFDIGLKYLNSQNTKNNSIDMLKYDNSEDIYFGVGVGGGITFAF